VRRQRVRLIDGDEIDGVWFGFCRSGPPLTPRDNMRRGVVVSRRSAGSDFEIQSKIIDTRFEICALRFAASADHSQRFMLEKS
jgi:hypothetical protein